MCSSDLGNMGFSAGPCGILQLLPLQLSVLRTAPGQQKPCPLPSERCQHSGRRAPGGKRRHGYRGSAIRRRPGQHQRAHRPSGGHDQERNGPGRDSFLRQPEHRLIPDVSSILKLLENNYDRPPQQIRR